jgi:hypothetical protein
MTQIQKFINVKDVEIYINDYTNELFNKSVYNYIEDKYYNDNKLYNQKLKLLQTTKIRDILVKHKIENNNLYFDVYNNNIISFDYKKLNHFKHLITNKIISDYNEQPNTYTVNNANNTVRYYIETILSSYTKKNDFKINLLDLSYAEFKILFKQELHEEFNNELITKINNLEEQIKYNESVSYYKFVYLFYAFTIAIAYIYK